MGAAVASTLEALLWVGASTFFVGLLFHPSSYQGITWATGNATGCATAVFTLHTHLRPCERSIKTEMKCDIDTSFSVVAKKGSIGVNTLLLPFENEQVLIFLI